MTHKRVDSGRNGLLSRNDCGVRAILVSKHDIRALRLFHTLEAWGGAVTKPGR